MINIERKVALLLALVLGLAVVVPVAAQEGEPPLPSCGEGSVSGTVVAVNAETGMVTVDSGGVQCTVTLDGEYDHPIVNLLGSYFGDVSAGSLAEALDGTQGCAVSDPESEGWAWADCEEEEDAVPVKVIAENEDGTFTVLMDGQEVTISVDPGTAEELREALQALSVDWELGEDGGVIQPGDEIAAYHEDGLGFGVLVKLYAMAAASQEDCDDEESADPCGVTVEDLVEAFQSGTGMGDLFEDYVRPSIRGVGHVRGNGRGRPDHAGPKDRADQPDDDADDDADDDDGGPLNLAGPKDKGGPPDHAGPPAHAGPKPKKPKKNK
jgi:hypothetical protein